jgi:hypothetical protein
VSPAELQSRRAQLDADWADVNSRLAQLAELRVVLGKQSPADVEEHLLQRLDEIEYEAGCLWFLERDGMLPPGMDLRLAVVDRPVRNRS